MPKPNPGQYDLLSLERTDPPTPEQEHTARLAVAANAIDAEDCEDLLRMLDLLP